MWNWIKKLEELRLEGQPAILVTVTQCTGSTPREPGAKMIVLPDGKFHGTIGGGHLEEQALEDAKKCFEENASKTIRYPLGAKTGQCCGGIVDLFFEVLNRGPRLYLFGAGHVGQAVCRTLVGTPFAIHLIDDRDEWIRSDQIPAEVVRHHTEWEDFVDEAAWDESRIYVGIMTHRHDTDQEIIEHLIQKKRPARYIGMIGSVAKWGRFRQRLLARGIKETELGRVKCPIGIDVGGKAPQEVAISFTAELLKIHYGKTT